MRNPGYKPTSRDEIKTQALECVANGLTDADTARRLGVHVNTLYNWKKKDPSFERDYGIAKLSLKEKYLKVVLYMAEHATTETVRLKAATWYLERKFPEEYAQHQVVHAPAERSPLDIMLGGDEEEESETIAGENAE